jgi:hypothetical protein
MLWLGIPVVDNHKLTQECLKSLVETVMHPWNFCVVLFDNGSEEPYGVHEFADTLPFKVKIERSERNRGYYRTITDLAAYATQADIVALCHNDLYFYEKGWDVRLQNIFAQQSNNGLGMVGFCGSNEIDDRGGRGGGTMVNFRGERGALTEHTGRRVTGLEPAITFDSLFLAIRRSLVPLLKVDDNIQLNHFGDRIWPLRLIERGIWCAVLGVEVDHMGGQTVVGVQRIEEDSRRWCEEHGVPIPAGMQAGTAVYLYAERLYLSEYRDQKHLLPARMMGWNIAPLSRTF